MESLAKDNLSRAARLLGQKGGLAKSARKTKAVRKNGKLGGRPKGSKNKEVVTVQ